MYRKNKKKLAITVIIFFISTIFYNLVPMTAYADQLGTVTGPYMISINTTGSNNGTYQSGQTMGINVNVTRIGTITRNDKIVIKLPSSLSGVQVDSSGLQGNFNYSQSGNTITLTPLPGASSLTSAYIGISATISKNLSNGNHKLPVEINNQGVSVPITISNPGTSTGGSSSSSGSISGGGVPVINPYANVDWGNHVDKYIVGGSSNSGMEKNMNIPVVNNSTVQYRVFVDTDGLSGPITFKDALPQGATYVPGSMTISPYPSQEGPQNIVGNYNVGRSGSDLTIGGFSPNSGKYIINYTCNLSNNLGDNQKLDNIVYLNGFHSSATVVANTSAGNITPGQEGKMLTKTVDKKVFMDGTTSLNYTLNVNPNNLLIKNAKIVDKMPAGVTLQAPAYGPNYSPNVYVNTFNKQGESDDGNFSVNIEEINQQGQASYPFGQYPVAQGTVVVNLQTNELTFETTATSDNIQIVYGANIVPGAKDIANTATITNNGGLTDSSTAISQYASQAGAMNFWKTAYWNNNGTIVQSSPITNGISNLNIDGKNNANVTYELHIKSTGYFPNGYLKFHDPVPAGVKIESVNVPSGINYKIDGNNVSFENTNYITPGYDATIKINCSLADIKGGSTVNNTAYVGYTPSDTVVVHKKSNTVKEQPGSLTITKTGYDNSKLEGATFTVTGPNNFSKTVTTSTRGSATLNDLPWGTYAVKETGAPKGYNLNSNEQTVIIGKQRNGSVEVNQNITVNDTVKLGSIKVVKTDAQTGKPVQGATFTATNTGTNQAFTGITGSNGIVQIADLPWGTYNVQETKAPIGYQINSQIQTVTINAQSFNSNGVFQEPTFNVKDNEMLGNLTITKTGPNNSRLEGAQFTVTGPNDYKEVVTTNSNGVATLSNLAWGAYKIQETKAPIGYSINKIAQNVVIGEQENGSINLNGSATISDSEVLGQLQITKTNENGTEKLEGAQFTVTGPNGFNKIVTTNADGVANLENLLWGTYTVKETSAPQGYNLNSQTQTVDVTNATVGQVQGVTFKDSEVLGNMQIVKTGINDTKLEGAQFTVTGPNGYKEVVTTNKDGVANLNNLAWGQYNIQETKAPAGYNLDEAVQTVNIDAKDATKLQTAAVKDSETTGTLEIEKTDATNEKEVAGAKIQIQGTSDNGQKIDIKFTSGTTPTKFTLPAGTYTYTEVDAPVGYQINKTVGHFTISEQGQIVKADVKDARVLGAMTVTKTGKGGVKLEGAQFTVKGPNGYKEVVTTNKDGVASLNNLTWGVYTVKETKAPTGYNINSQVQTVTIDAQDATNVQAVTVSDTQILGQISITKTNENGTEKLQGAEFTVTGPNGFSKVVTTDKDGVVNLDNLAWGTYTVKETKAPIGYNLNPEVQTVEVTAASVGKVQSVTEKDTVTTGTLNIEKTDITNEKEVAGAKIQITGKALDGQKIDITFTSGTTPTKFTLPAGTYTYTEVDAPVGYLINKTVGHFTISEQGQIVKADVKDARVLGQMTITKTNEKGTEKLEGAQFTVTGLNGYKEVVTTNKDGVISLNNLAWGTYKVQETKAPVGYNLNPEVQTVNIEANDAAKIQALTEKDTATTGTLVIEKTDVTNEKEVAGAKIQITGTSVLGKKIDITFTSGTTPTKFTLPAGTYTYTEVDAPVGYLINKTVGHFTISEQGQIVKADVKDARILGQMIITKTNENGTEKLEGAQFTVTGPNGYKEVLTTNKDGVINLKDLAWGTYTVKETKAPIGYSLNNDVQTVKIDAQDAAKMQSVSIKDAKILGQISITKTNENGTVKLQGAEFKVTGPNGYKEVVTTNKDGVANLKDLAWGTYKVQETKAPVGYSLNNEVQTVEVTAASVGKVQSVSVKDNQILGNLTITKTNENGTEMLQGAEFKVTGPNGFKEVVTTGANGIASLSDLEWGTYYVKEIKAPQGYNINNTIYTITINAQDALIVQAVKVKDSKIQEVSHTTKYTNSNTNNSTNGNSDSGNNATGLSPQTSDASQLPIYILLGIAIVGLVLNTRRKKKTAK